MAGKVAAPPEKVAAWRPKLRASRERRDDLVAQAKQADDDFRDLINAGFDDGLSATDMEGEEGGTGLSVPRLYQIRKGSRT